MYSAIKNLLFHPDAFFTQKRGEETNIVIPALIIFIGGIVGLISPSVIDVFIPGHSRNIIMMPDTVIVSLGLPFITWILISGILYVLCRLFSGTGTFYATLQNVGYGSLPYTISLLFGIIDGVVIGRFVEISRIISIGALMGLGLLSLLFLIWSGWLWACAMEKTHFITHYKAIIAATIVVLLFLSPVLINILALVHITGWLTQ